MATLTIKKVTALPELLAPGAMYLVKPPGGQKVTVYFSDAAGENHYQIDSLDQSDVQSLVENMVGEPNGLAGLVEGYVPNENIPVILNNKTLANASVEGSVTKKTFEVMGTTPAISPNNNPVQKWVLTGNSTPTAGTWLDNQAIELVVDDGNSFVIDWSAMGVVWTTNNGNSPALNATQYTFLRLWKFENTIYGERVGDH